MEANKKIKHIPLMVPSINENDINAVVEVLRTGMLVQGKHVAELEKKIKYITQTSHAVAVSNGTATLHLALLASGIKAGDEVIVPAFSYIATANVVELVGAKPVFVDIEFDTFNINVSLIERAINANTKAIIPVHEFGLACDISKLVELAKRNNLIVIEDAACALGAKENGKAVGGLGNFGSFSLHPRKSVTSGEGGVITTNDAATARKLQTLRNHGIDPEKGNMEFIAAGLNYRLTEFQAALVNSQLERLEEIISYKQKLAEVYYDELQHPLIKLPLIPRGKNHTWQTFHVVIQQPVNRDKVIEELKKEGIGANYGAQCIPEQKFYKEKYGLNSAVAFPNAFNAWQQGLAIPIYNKLTKEDISYISKIIKKTIEKC